MIGIIDYGVGNLRSIANALNECGAEQIITSNKNELNKCEKLILPGVGAFKHGMNALRERGLDDFVRNWHLKEKPLLGICLGMQLLTEISYEFGETKGLNLVNGIVKKISLQSKIERKLRLPIVGWYKFKLIEKNLKDKNNFLINKILTTKLSDSTYYFIHSFSAELTSKDLIAYTDHVDFKTTAIISRRNTIGTQFHPEKSGLNGIEFLKNYIFLN